MHPESEKNDQNTQSQDQSDYDAQSAIFRTLKELFYAEHSVAFIGSKRVWDAH